jgi:hypothetical protein
MQEALPPLPHPLPHTVRFAIVVLTRCLLNRIAACVLLNASCFCLNVSRAKV